MTAAITGRKPHAAERIAARAVKSRPTTAACEVWLIVGYFLAAGVTIDAATFVSNASTSAAVMTC